MKWREECCGVAIGVGLIYAGDMNESSVTWHQFLDVGAPVDRKSAANRITRATLASDLGRNRNISVGRIFSVGKYISNPFWMSVGTL